MEIKLAKTAGFCFGVKRAMDITNDESKNKNIATSVFTLGPIIHNEQVVNKLILDGISPIDSFEKLPENSRLILRTHGVSKNIYNELQNKNISYIDATCPFVKKIHKIVSDNYKLGYQIVIAGDKNHPEVIGINGWCENSAIIIENAEDIFAINHKNNLCFVSQTTFSLKKWEEIKKIAKNTCQTPLIFDTICIATEQRQNEAEAISKSVDAMVVIGGKHSSNTLKLVNVCKKNCDEVYHIETASELPSAIYYKRLVGVTAGASTPSWIIKEVIFDMAEEKLDSELNFAEELEKSMVSLKTGDIVKGTVIDITPTNVYVNLGSKADGNIPVSELTDDDSISPEDIVKIGEEIEVFVVRVNDAEGEIKLSKKKVDSIAGYKKIEDANGTDEVLTGKVIEAVKGGLIVLSNGVRVFVPASQATVRRGEDLNQYVGTTVDFRIIDVNLRRRKIVGSIRSVAYEERKKQLDEFWSTVEVGKEYDGIVKSLTDFGAFVDIGGIDGLVHISELSWGRIKHPSEIVNVGDAIKVFVLSFDKETHKVSLGYKKAEDNPWEVIKTKIAKDDVIKAKIVRLVPFGAFAEIIPFVDGLIHISQISTEHIDKPASVLSVGQEVDVKVMDIDLENKKISLSMRALLEEAADTETTDSTEE